ncbi:hypothetical protein [Erwinia tasmaniensis]|uniref:hypothetical protein n=1 Tax=Erwinia tasmaniensis TaxID=338565 RepID=UPI0005B53EA6|nr:hypothetical protein [Erwinia tasmaniensis]
MRGVAKTEGSISGTYRTTEGANGPQDAFTRSLKGVGNSSQPKNNQRSGDGAEKKGGGGVTRDKAGNMTISGVKGVHIGKTTVFDVCSAPKKK